MKALIMILSALALSHSAFAASDSVLLCNKGERVGPEITEYSAKVVQGDDGHFTLSASKCFEVMHSGCIGPDDFNGSFDVSRSDKVDFLSDEASLTKRSDGSYLLKVGDMSVDFASRQCHQ